MMEGFMSNESHYQGTSSAGSCPKGLKRKLVLKEDRGRKQGNCIDDVKNVRVKITARRICPRDVVTRIHGEYPANFSTGCAQARHIPIVIMPKPDSGCSYF